MDLGARALAARTLPSATRPFGHGDHDAAWAARVRNNLVLDLISIISWAVCRVAG
jgi:hypothetical protein